MVYKVDFFFYFLSLIFEFIIKTWQNPNQTNKQHLLLEGIKQRLEAVSQRRKRFNFGPIKATFISPLKSLYRERRNVLNTTVGMQSEKSGI